MKRAPFSDEHRLFRETVAAFVIRDVLPQREQSRAQRQIGREVWRIAGEQGLLGLGVPERCGGSDVNDFRFNAILGEELAARAGLAYASCFGIQTDVVVPYLTGLTSASQQARWLPGVCSGATITAIAMTEPGAGSDLGALRTAAEKCDGGWRLNGSKTFITNGANADLVVVAARTSRESRYGITLFVVEDGMDGFTRGRKLDKVGQPESDTAELFFEDVHVPADNVIGDVGRGFVHMMERLPQERLSGACANIAHAASILALTVSYAKERRAFGRAIGSFQHNRFKLAELVTEIDVSQAYVDRCLLMHVAGELAPEDAAKAKWWTAEVQNRVIDGCLQLFGGYGYMQEYDVARAWTDARVTKIWGGTNEIMKEIVGRSLGLVENEPTTDSASASRA